MGRNRRRLADRLDIGDPSGWCWLRQVHGRRVVLAEELVAADDDGSRLPSSRASVPPRAVPEADAALSGTAGVPLVVLTADCAPVALACDDAVGVAHAGWPGLLAGVLEAAVERLREIGRGRVRAALGPCIHPARYEFGRADLDRLVARLGPEVESRTDTGSPALDVPAAVRGALARVGVTDLDDVDVCTAASPDHFSYRRDGITGRQAMVVTLDG